MHIELTNKREWGDNRWQNVTGEFARYSGFTYKPYHVLINEAIEDYLGKFSDGNHDTDRLPIPALGDSGKAKTVAGWRRYANRSQIIHERLTREGAFGYIDAGNIQYGDEIGFLITQADNKELIIYLTHKGNIIGDLNHPKYGSKRDSSLKRLYQEFRDEFISAGVEECQSKYKTHVSGVAAGFPRFIDNKNAIKPNTWPFIADYKADAENIKFWINGYRDFSSYVWHNHYLRPLGRKGKPFALIPAPNHLHGSDERRAVPIYISEIVENSIEWRVIKAAFKCKDRNERFDIDDFFKKFFNCYDAITLGRQDGTLELQDDRITISCNKARIIKVISRDVDSYSGKNISSIIKYDPEDDQVYITNLQCLRAKLSYELLYGNHNNSYNEVAKCDSSLPKSYADFLKQICRIPLLDLRLHNSWISLNKLQFNNDGTVEEIKNFLSIEQNDLDNDKWRESVIIHDSLTNEAFRVWIENLDQVPWVYRVDFRKGEKPFVELKCTDRIKEFLLPILAFSITKKRQLLYHGKYDDKLQFGYDDTLYEFTVNGINFDEAYYTDGYRGEDDHGETIWDIEYSYADNSFSSSGLSIGSIKPISNVVNERRVYKSGFFQKMDIIARHYNGSDDSWKTIISKWFSSSISHDKEMLETLKIVLQDFKCGNTISITPINASRLMKYLKFDRSDNEQSRKEIYDIIRHLERLGLKINIGIEEGQKLLSNIESNISFISFFMSNDGKVVYGFVDKRTGTIYLDRDLLNIETIVHEYTHLWIKALRHNKPLVWAQLVEDLRSVYFDIWRRVTKSYRSIHKASTEKSKDFNNLIAEEVFAHIVGKRWSDGFPRENDHYYMNGTIESSYNELRRRHESYDYKKEIMPKDRIDYLQETVAIDLLSNHPFTYFGTLEEWVEEQEEENKLVTVNLPHLDKKGFRLILRELSYSYNGGIIERIDTENQTITVRSKDLDYLNHLLSDNSDNDDFWSFHIDIDEETYLPDIFEKKQQEQDNKAEIDFTEFKQFTQELYEKLIILDPCKHYIEEGEDGSKGLVFLGKGEQTLYLPQIESETDLGLINSVTIAIGNPIRSSKGKKFFVLPCDRKEEAIDYLSAAIGYYDERPKYTNPDVDNLKDFSKTPVLSSDLYRDLLSLGHQMRLTKFQQSKKGGFYKTTLFYGKGNMTLTLNENSRIGHLIYSKNGVNYHTVPCDLDDHLVDNISRSIEYQGHTPIPRIIKSEFIDFSKHRVLNKTLYTRLLKQGKHMRLTKENESGKYVVFYGASLINLFVTEQTKIGALIRPVYKDYRKLIGYKALPCDASHYSINDISESIGYTGEIPIIKPNPNKLKNFQQEKILTMDLYKDLLSLGPSMRWTRNNKDGKYVTFYGTGRNLFVSLQSHIGSLIVLIKDNYYALPCDADERMADEVTEKIGYVGIKPAITPDLNNLKDFRKYKVLTEELYTDLLSLGAHLRWTREDNKGKYVIFYGIRGSKLYISSRTRIGALITAINDKSYTALPCDADEHMVDVISNAIGFNEVTQEVNPDPKNLKDFSKYKILTKELYADLLALGPGMRLTTLTETEEYVTFYGRITTEQRTRDVEYYYEDGGYYGIEPEEYDVKVRRNLIVSNKTKIGAPICLDGDDYRVLPCDSDEHLVDEISECIGHQDTLPIEQPDSRLISRVFHNHESILTSELYSNLLALGPCMRHTDEDENGKYVTFYCIDSSYRDLKKLTVSSNSLIGMPIQRAHNRVIDEYRARPCDRHEESVDKVSKSIGYFGDKPLTKSEMPEGIIFYDKDILTEQLYRELLALGIQRRFTTTKDNEVTVVFHSNSGSLEILNQAKIGSPIYHLSYNHSLYHVLPCDKDENLVDQISITIGYDGDKPPIDINIFKEKCFSDEKILTKDLYRRLLALGPYMRWTSEDENGPFVAFYRGNYRGQRQEVLIIPHNARLGSSIIIDRKTAPRWSVYTTPCRAQPFNDNDQKNND